MDKRILGTGLLAAVDAALSHGIAVHTAIAKRSGKYYLHFKVTSYDERCTICMPENDKMIKEKEIHDKREE